MNHCFLLFHPVRIIVVNINKVSFQNLYNTKIKIKYLSGIGVVIINLIQFRNLMSNPFNLKVHITFLTTC